MRDIREGRDARRPGLPGGRRQRLGRWSGALAAACLATVTASVPAAVAGAPAVAAPSTQPSLLSARAAAPRFCVSALPSDAQVRLTWTPPVSPSNFTFFEGSAPGTGQPVTPDTVADGSAVVTGLTNGATYYFWLATIPVGAPGAVPAAGPVVVSNAASATPRTVPGPPGGLTATAGNAQVRLSWTAPAADGGLPLTGYNVLAGTGSDGEAGAPVNTSPVTGTSYPVTGLVNGTTYFFKVVAVNAAGAGLASGEASATPATTPGTPGGLTPVPGNAQVTLSWTAPASTGGAPVTGYDLYAATKDAFAGVPPLARVTGTVATVTGLVNGTRYYFRVAAVNRVGEGQAAQAQAAPLTVPGAPGDPNATAGNGQVRLSWTPPAADGGLPVTGYLVYRGTSPDGETGVPVGGSPVTGTSYPVTGLVNGTTYYFKVVAVNAAGLSPLSAEASATPRLTGSSTSSPPDTASSSSVTSSAGTSSSATSSSATSTPSEVAARFTAPTGLTAGAGNNQVSLSWTAPTASGGSPVVSYTIYVATAPGVPGRPASGRPGTTYATVKGLPNGAVYYFMVTAVNAAGQESPLSTQVSATPAGPVTGIRVGLDSPAVPAQLIALLATVAAMGAAGLFTLITRRGRRSRRAAHARRGRTRTRSRRQLTAATDVRAVSGMSRPERLSVRDIGPQPTRTIRFESHPGVATTTLKERRP